MLLFTFRGHFNGKCADVPVRREFWDVARQTYSRAASGLYILEGNVSVGVTEIHAVVQRHCTGCGQVFVVMMDYLQILSAADPRATDKQNTDRAVVALKQISRDLDIPIIVISGFVRENYRVTVSIETFKESGVVEHSSRCTAWHAVARCQEQRF